MSDTSARTGEMPAGAVQPSPPMEFAVSTYAAGPASEASGPGPEAAARQSAGGQYASRTWLVTGRESGRQHVIDPAVPPAPGDEGTPDGPYLVAPLTLIRRRRCYLQGTAGPDAAAQFAVSHDRTADTADDRGATLVHAVSGGPSASWLFLRAPGTVPVPLNGPVPANLASCTGMLARAGIREDAVKGRTAAGVLLDIADHEPGSFLEFGPSAGGGWDWHAWNGPHGRAESGVPGDAMRNILLELHGQSGTPARMTPREFAAAAAARGIPGMQMADISGVGYDPLPCGRLPGRDFYLHGNAEAKFAAADDPMPPLLGLCVRQGHLFTGDDDPEQTWSFLPASQALQVLERLAAYPAGESASQARRVLPPEYAGHPYAEALARMLTESAMSDSFPDRLLYATRVGKDITFSPVPRNADGATAKAPAGACGAAAAGEFWGTDAPRGLFPGKGESSRAIIRAVTVHTPDGAWTAWRRFLEAPVRIVRHGEHDALEWPGELATSALASLAAAWTRTGPPESAARGRVAHPARHAARDSTAANGR